MINQIGMLQEQGNTCKDLDWGAFRILKTDWLSLPDWLTEKSLTDWQKSDWLTDWLTKCLTVLLTEWLTDKSLTDWLTDKSLTDWLMDAVQKNKMQNLGVLFRLTDWLTDWLTDTLDILGLLNHEELILNIFGGSWLLMIDDILKYLSYMSGLHTVYIIIMKRKVFFRWIYRKIFGFNNLHDEWEHLNKGIFLFL